jgi:hypothetical protein
MKNKHEGSCCQLFSVTGTYKLSETQMFRDNSPNDVSIWILTCKEKKEPQLEKDHNQKIGMYMWYIQGDSGGVTATYGAHF